MSRHARYMPAQQMRDIGYIVQIYACSTNVRYLLPKPKQSNQSHCSLSNVTTRSCVLYSASVLYLE